MHGVNYNVKFTLMNIRVPPRKVCLKANQMTVYGTSYLFVSQYSVSKPIRRYV